MFYFQPVNVTQVALFMETAINEMEIVNVVLISQENVVTGLLRILFFIVKNCLNSFLSCTCSSAIIF